MNTPQKIKQVTSRILFVFVMVFLSGIGTVWAQENNDAPQEEEKDERPVRSTFESALLIDNHSVMVPKKNTLEWDMQHRFGTIDNGYDDLIGLYAPSNIRMGFSYTVIDNLAVGFGFTKLNKLWDFSAKYAILKQTRSGSMPLSLTAYANTAVDTRTEDNFIHETDRLTYFSEIIIARKINGLISLQLAPSISHFNAINENMSNDHIAISAGGRVKLSETSSSAVIFEVDQAITSHSKYNPHPNLSLGYEVATSGHAFQIFLGNYKSIINQYNNVLNVNDYEDGEFLIGFNITRLWSF